MFVGVDGCATGWVAIEISASGDVGAACFPTFAALIDHHRDADAIGVDMPLGLVEAGRRDTDGAARRFLKGQASSVFSTPPRPVLAARDYVEACRISVQLSGTGLSKQSFSIMPKISEVDAFVDRARLHEVHPEVSFRVLNAGDRVTGRKKSWGGLHQRLALLRSAGIEVPGDLPAAHAVGIDDVVDAAVAAWSARRIARGEARSFPDPVVQRDRSGREIAIRA